MSFFSENSSLLQKPTSIEEVAKTYYPAVADAASVLNSVLADSGEHTPKQMYTLAKALGQLKVELYKQKYKNLGRDNFANIAGVATEVQALAMYGLTDIDPCVFWLSGNNDSLDISTSIYIFNSSRGETRDGINPIYKDKDNYETLKHNAEKFLALCDGGPNLRISCRNCTIS